MKPSRLSGRKVNDYLRRKGNVWKGRTMTIKWLRGSPRNPNVDRTATALYIGTAASLKLHKTAVKRNRMRRRCREAMRKYIKEVDKLPTMQLLITPRISSLDCGFSEITEDVERFFGSIER